LENGLHSQSFGDNISERHVPGKRRRIRIQGHVTQLSAGSVSDISEYETDEEGNGNIGDVGSESVKHAYRDETWTQNSFTYDPKPQQFIGRRYTAQFFEHIPTILQLFEFFWPFNLLRKIVNETSRYATEPIDAQGNTRGGSKMGDVDGCRLQSILGHSHVYGNETATKLQDLLGERRQLLPLSNHFQHYDKGAFYTIT
jgi:hypothetical protein